MRNVMPRLVAAFFASGFAALLCQIIWQRMLGIFAGSDTISAALVVGAFLSGLGLGSILGAWLADRWRPAKALIGFAVAEAGVGAFALLSKAFLYDWLATDLAGVVDHPLAIFSLCFAGLVLPTTLMGASLPLLSRAVATSAQTLAERIGTLYGLNTLGAGLGALVGGWLLVGNLGFVGALWLAAGLNWFAAALALTLLPAMRTQPETPPTEARTQQAEPFGSLHLWCLLVFLSGYVIVALEIVWVRLIGQIGQYHAYLFPTVLGIFLLADGLGIAVAARMVRGMADPRPAFFITQSAGFVVAMVLAACVWIAIPYWPLADWMAVDQSRLGGGALAIMVGLTVLMVGPPAFLIGMTFPFVQRAVQRDLASVGTRVGWVQLANIAGNAAGSLGTGLLTLHWFGSAGTLTLIALLSLVLVLGWLWKAGWRWAESALAGACALALIAIPSNASLWSRPHGEAPRHQVAWAEDRTGVAFFRGEPSPVPFGTLFIQGFSQGQIPFLPIHQFLGAIGPLLHPDPRKLLVIGVGSGGTPWAAGIRPDSHVRAIELVEPVLTVLEQVGQRHPDSVAARLFRDKRWQVEYGDGRRVLAKETTRYDIIEADAILPWSSHSGLLYSRDFLEQARARLMPHGLMVQWAPTTRVIETFASVFPHAVLLLPAAVMIGSRDPIAFDAAELRRRLADPAVIAHLRAGNPDFSDWASLFAEPPIIWTPDTPRVAAPLTDVFPRDEFYLNNKVVPTEQYQRKFAEPRPDTVRSSGAIARPLQW